MGIMIKGTVYTLISNVKVKIKELEEELQTLEDYLLED